MTWCVILLVVVCFNVILLQMGSCTRNEEVAAPWQPSRTVFPTSSASWSLQTRIPMTPTYEIASEEEGRGRFKVKKKLKKLMLPLLLAYKLKFFTLIPVMLGGLVLLIGSTGMAGFFFALFAAVMGLKGGTGH